MLASPVVGAMLYTWLHDRSRATRLVDRSMLIIIPALIIWQVVPHGWASYKFWAIVSLAAGAALPTLFEHAFQRLRPHTDNLALLAGFSGLFLHAFLEGAAIVPEPPGSGLVLAIAIHRVPVGLMIWWLLRPRHGFKIASLGIAGLLTTTTAGFAIAAWSFDTGQISHDHGMVDLFQAFVGGSLLHVVFHQGRMDHNHDAPEGGEQGHHDRGSSV